MSLGLKFTLSEESCRLIEQRREKEVPVGHLAAYLHLGGYELAVIASESLDWMN